jgi:hypothetical protein
LFLLLALRRRRQAAALAHGVSLPTEIVPADSVAAERRELVRAVAELDERFATGALDETTYREQREQQKARLVALARATADT